MNITDHLGIIPQQHTGKQIEAADSKIFTNSSEAERFFKVARQRLFNVNNWHSVAGIVSAEFSVCSPAGRQVKRCVQKNDYLKIDIPGPGSSEGNGYDWVHVEELKEFSEGSIQSAGFRVRPAPNPFGAGGETAHFYALSATSSFIVTREDVKVSVFISDRNIKPNDIAESLTDKIRHTAVAMSAIGNFSKMQWQKLAEGILAEKEN